jgi:hypothetical protein
MSATIDHLWAWRQVTVRRAFADFEGRRHEVGETWLITRIDYEYPKHHAIFHIEQAGQPDRFTLDLKDKNGPRDNEMREWFDAEDEDPELREIRLTRLREAKAAVAAQAAPKPVPPPVAEKPAEKIDPAPILERLSALAEHERYAEAEAELQRLFKIPHYDSEGLPGLAEALEGLAAEVCPRNRRAAIWLYDRAFDCWHGWGSMATSGGDGTARMYHIKQAQARREKLLGAPR